MLQLHDWVAHQGFYSWGWPGILGGCSSHDLSDLPAVNDAMVTWYTWIMEQIMDDDEPSVQVNERSTRLLTVVALVALTAGKTCQNPEYVRLSLQAPA